jgi:hypothetical protein
VSGLLTHQTCSFHRAFRHAMRWTGVVRPALDGQCPVSSYLFCDLAIGGQNHAHYYPRLCDCFHGPHNDRWGRVGPFPFGRNNGSASVEILRNDNRNDIWRPCHGWPCAGLAPASRDKRSRLNQSGILVPRVGMHGSGIHRRGVGNASQRLSSGSRSRFMVNSIFCDCSSRQLSISVW